MNNEKEYYTDDNYLLKTIGIIGGMLIVTLLITLAVLNVFVKPQVGNITTYKSIVSIEQVKMKNMQNREILDLLIQQDKDLTEYVNKKPKANIDGLFEIFYRNLLAFTGDIADVNEKFTYSGFGEQNQAKDGIEFSFTMDKKFPDYVETVKLVKPKTDLFTMAHTQDANFEAKINYNYLINRYSANLSPALQQFLNIRQNEVSKLNGPYYGEGGWAPTPDLLTKFYLDEQQLLNKYPNFILKDIVQNTLKIHTTELTSPAISFNINILFDMDKNDYTKCTKLNNNVKTAYEEFLKKANKDTKEYKIINDLYETIKRNDFKYTYEVYKILYDSTGKKDYLETYNTEKEKYEAEEDKRKTINEYKNLKYDKEQLHKLYKEAKESWEIHQQDKDEDGSYLYGGTGSYVSYITSYINENSIEFKKVLDCMWNYCDITITDNEGLAGVRNCYIEEIEK